MDKLLVNARVLTPSGMVDGCLRIKNGIIAEINNTLKPLPNETVYDCKNHILAPGVIDGAVHLRHLNRLPALLRSAKKGGVTTAICLPNHDTTPENLSHLLSLSPNIHAWGRASNQDHLGEMMVSQKMGAVGVGDGEPLLNAHVADKVMAYANGLKCPLMVNPIDKSLYNRDTMTEGEIATRLGLPTSSPLAEEIGLARDLALASHYKNIKLLIAPITTAKSVEMVRNAKKKGLNIKVATSLWHLMFNETAIGDYRTFAKIQPPLRCEQDRKALVGALGDGTLDMVLSFDDAHDVDEKRLPFHQAEVGASATECMVPVMLSLAAQGYLDLPQAFRLLSENIADFLDLPQGRIALSHPAHLILIDPDAPWILNMENLTPGHRNVPFDTLPVTGKVLDVFNS